MSQAVALPAAVQAFCDKAAARWKLNLSAEADQRKIAQSILQLSDFFINSPESPTPWKEVWAQQAYAFYFLPLNSIRVQRVLSHTQAFIDQMDLEQIVDFGAGLATASRLLANGKQKLMLIERSDEPKQLVQECDPLASQYAWQKLAPHQLSQARTLSCFSYSLTELAALPGWIWHSEAVLILEPSTQQDGRRLQVWRDEMIQKGWQILAPCTHQQACPLLVQSKTDWCHDRVITDLPDWMLQIEEHLPMRNRSLTVSYLLAVKNKTSMKPKASTRVIGDLLKEKGKDRQLVCRGPEREFLSWMHKHGNHEEIPRGVLIDLPEEIQKVANELRIPGGAHIQVHFTE